MNPEPRPIHSLAELRTWLLDCAEQLTNFERTLAAPDSPSKRTRCILGSSTSPSERQERLHALSVRLALISDMLMSQVNGMPLMTAEQQLLDLMLRAQLDRLGVAIGDLTTRPQPDPIADYVELGLWPPNFPGVMLPGDG